MTVELMDLIESVVIILLGGGASSTIVTLVLKRVIKKITVTVDEFELIKKANQVQIRKDLMNIYKECRSKGYADDEDREEFLNLYEVYHDLGKNGYMDDKKEKLFAMNDYPTYNRRSSDCQ